MKHLTPSLPLVLLGLLVPLTLAAQWTNRYPKVEGYGHHVYLEGYELPILSNGPVDAVPAPEGDTWTIASRGWLWSLDPTTGVARRITSGGGMDSQPAWSPDGRMLAFVRDDASQLSIVLRDADTGSERVLVQDSAIVLHPAFSPDGRFLFYSSAAAGDVDLWRMELATGTKTRLTEERGLELQPLPTPDGSHLVYVAKTRGEGDQVRIRDLADGSEWTLYVGSILSQTRPALSPDGRTVALALPTEDGWELQLMDIESPTTTVRLTAGVGIPFTPAWSRDGSTLVFSRNDEEERMLLRRIPASGGEIETIPVSRWEWGEPTGRVRIRTRMAGGTGDLPTRLNVRDASGHPAVPTTGMPRFDGQNGIVYFFSPGTIELEVSPGEIEVSAVHGLETPVQTVRQRVEPGETAEIEIELAALWDPRAEGWYSGDHHFHLNYGGQYRLEPEDLIPMLRAEDVDVATPLIANLHNRFGDQPLWGWEHLAEPPLVRFGQEVRSHFLGHVGLIGTDRLFWPWVWGPGYQVYGRDDRTNAEPLEFARQQDGLGSYVHPVSRPGPFAQEDPPIPIELIADAVMGDLDALEIACLWSDELGTSDVWYRLLNLGLPVAQTAGTDAMTDFFRTMALGTTRVYVLPEGPFNFDSYLAGLRAGRSFVTNGPLLDFRVEGAQPGEPLASGDREANWTLDLRSAIPVERVEVLVNGEVVWEGEGLTAAGERSFSGTLALPAGGWILARAYGGEITQWPAMDSYAFGQTSPVWIGQVGSTDPQAEREAARELLRALDSAERRLVAGYEGVEIPKLRTRFAEARAELERRIGEEGAVGGQ